MNEIHNYVISCYCKTEVKKAVITKQLQGSQEDAGICVDRSMMPLCLYPTNFEKNQQLLVVERNVSVCRLTSCEDTKEAREKKLSEKKKIYGPILIPHFRNGNRSMI